MALDQTLRGIMSLYPEMGDECFQAVLCGKEQQLRLRAAACMSEM